MNLEKNKMRLAIRRAFKGNDVRRNFGKLTFQVKNGEGMWMRQGGIGSYSKNADRMPKESIVSRFINSIMP